MPQHLPRHSDVSYVKMAANQSRCRLGYGLWWPKEACIGAQIPRRMGNMPGHARRHSAVAVRKWLNRPIRRLGCGLGWAESYSRGGANVPCPYVHEPSV